MTTATAATIRGARRRLVDGSEQSRHFYHDETHHHARDAERHRAECERLLDQRSRNIGGAHDRVKDRAQRMAENGEALRYIELMLRQLQRASRDHRELVRQRHANLQHEMSRRINERIVWCHHQQHHHRDGGVNDSTDTSFRTWSRSSSSPWQSDLTLRKSRPDVTTRLLTKRKDYGGTAQSTVSDILRPARQVQRAAAVYQEMRHIAESVGWQDARRRTFGARSLPESASSRNDRTASSTSVV